MSEMEVRDRLRAWIIGRGRAGPDGVRDATPLLEERILTSLDVLEFLSFVEHLRGAPLQISELRPGTMASIDTVYAHFFGGSAPC